MNAAEGFHRHDWVWVEEACLPDLREVRRHGASGWPFVVGRSPVPDRPAILQLGLALPGRRRLGFSVEAAGIDRHRAPLSLAECLPSAPEVWLPGLRTLLARFEDAGMEPNVYGSLAWQAMTGTIYLHEDSDLDLLLAPATEGQLRLALAMLEAMEGARPRLDGEIVLPGGRAVAWREAASPSATLLVKTVCSVALVPRTTWMSALLDLSHA